ncbi:MAG: hypothetical protein JO189_21170 [Deltaproteobacteria bacterium]|nr:hypothetical protein [Deltaproteobacteria bacterium]
MKSRYQRFMTLALVSSLTTASMTVMSPAADAGQSSLKAKAQAELAAVTVDVDRANIMFSPADDGLGGGNFSQIVQYQQEYLSGRQSFDQGKYAETLQQLNEAEQIIRSQPDWTQAE